MFDPGLVDEIAHVSGIAASTCRVASTAGRMFGVFVTPWPFSTLEGLDKCRRISSDRPRLLDGQAGILANCGFKPEGATVEDCAFKLELL